MTEEQLNDFEYVNSDGSGDPRGLRCPVGAHIRRANPRGQPVQGQGSPGGSNNAHRLIRRGMPYGPRYDPSAPHDGVERGLLGYFIHAYIENQYEFVLKEWVEAGSFVGRVRLNPGSKDALVGANDPAASVFEIPQHGGPPLKVTGFSRFITTKAVAYCFLPSLSALRWIAGSRTRSCGVGCVDERCLERGAAVRCGAGPGERRTTSEVRRRERSRTRSGS